MRECFESSKWIWTSRSSGIDEYGDFFCSFDSDKAPTVCRISCDGDYTLFVNGQFASSNQYGDFEHYKVYDEIDITPYLKQGNNEMYILVWHFGENSQRYINSTAGLIFEVAQGADLLAVSDGSVMCRKNQAYLNGYGKQITVQLGLSFLYDARKEGLGELEPATVVEKACTFFKRPIKKAQLLAPASSNILKNQGNYYLIDLGAETVGLPTLEFFSEAEQKITVAWGEDLQDEKVRRIIGGRDFSFEYIARKGRNTYTNYMLRLGCRYLELYAESPIELTYLGVIPQIYPVSEREVTLEESLDQQIYDICVRTLRLSMMEHYVDTPWREQCLYAFDSRNQMLCGYRAFKDGNAEYARANLLLMSYDRREDGLLSICFPCGNDMAIPSFSLYYFIAVKEYIENTGDVTLGKEVYPKLLSVLNAFINNRADGLVLRFDNANRWNFYDWTKYLKGNLKEAESSMPDLVINCLFIIALEALKYIAEKTENCFEYDDILESARIRAREAFYDEEKRAFSVTEGGGEFTVLGNALAILSGIADDPEEICEQIASGDLLDCTLSMKCFKYDALLMTDREKWYRTVIGEIREDYSKMIEAGATSVWETVQGASAFKNAGSLCHGWSAVPICYL